MRAFLYYRIDTRRRQSYHNPMKRHNNPSYLIFILTLSLLAIIVLFIKTVFKLDREVERILHYADYIVCAVFFVDFCILLFRAENKLRYFCTWGWIDLLSSIPVLYSFRWGRIARITRIFTLLRGVKSAKILFNLVLDRRAQSVTLAMILVSIIVLTFSAILVLHFESTAMYATIKTAEDAFWWSIVTITTVGYGDKVPVTPEGRIVAAMLMIVGVGLFGTLSGFVASWFVGHPKAQKETDTEAIQKEIAGIKEILEDLRRHQKP